jgi:hypothetical protein
MDRRYRVNYGMSTKENLEYIRDHGLERFIRRQYAWYRCPRCPGMVSVHNGKCFACDAVTRLVQKKAERTAR